MLEGLFPVQRMGRVARPTSTAVNTKVVYGKLRALV